MSPATLALTVCAMLARDLAPDETLRQILKTICEQLGWSVASYWSLDEQDTVLRCEIQVSGDDFPIFYEASTNLEFAFGIGLPGRVWKSGQPIWLSDVVTTDYFVRSEAAKRDGLHCAVAFPVTARGKFVGVFEFFGRKITEPDEELLNNFLIISAALGQLAERRRVEAELAMQVHRFEQFAAAVDETFFVSAPQLTKHHYVSPGFEKIWGLPVGAVFENAEAWLHAVLPEHRERVRDYVLELVGETMPESPEIDYPIRRADGSLAWLSARCFRIHKEDGTWDICGTVRDITERKLAQDRIVEFYSVVSHELRTPLTSIHGSLLLLERDKAGSLEMRAHDLVSIARKECDRLIRLINDMLDIRTIQVGKLQLALQPLFARTLLEQNVQALQSLADETGVKLHIECHADVKFSADKDRVLQVLANLLSNAIKFSPAGATVTVAAERAGKSVKFSVTDQGKGISPRDQDKLFKVFERIPQVNGGHLPGTGLGLAISKGIVDEHGGTIGVVSEAGKGAMFWFTLPITPVQRADKI